jgi:hypothetical protein
MSPLLFLLLAAPGFLVQPPGEFHDGEPVVADGESVLALHDDGTRAWLASTRIAMDRVADLMLDVPGEPETGWRVGDAGGTDGIVTYLRGDGLHPRDVPRARVDSEAGPGAFATPGAVDLWLGDAHYRLVAACSPHADAPRDATASLDCRIDLVASDGRHARLAGMSGYVDPSGRVGLGDEAAAGLLFAGDLDGDGRLDLVFDTSHHYNVRRPTLFLSRGTEGAPVRAVAHQASVGC